METIKSLKWSIGSKVCRVFGHKIDMVDKIMMDIKNVAENREDFLEDYILCKRCGAEFRLNPQANI